jgi:hypothetical protein
MTTYALATTVEVLAHAAACGTVSARGETCRQTLSDAVAGAIKAAPTGQKVYLTRTIFYTEVWQRLPQSDAWALLTTEEEASDGEGFSTWTD